MKLDTSQTVFFVKSVLFLFLSLIFYVVYFTEIIKKYADGYTYLLTYQEILKSEVKPPFLTLCPTPRAKMSILDKYNMSFGSLNEPTTKEIKILSNLNKTVEDLFREATYMLNVDFRLFVTFWYYESKDGWTQYKKELFEGTENYVKVYIKDTIILMFYV